VVETTAGRRVDRWIAVSAVVVAALVLVPLAVFSATRDSDPATHDPKAAADLVARMRAGEQIDYVADYAFARRRAGGATLRSTMTIAHWHNAVYTRTGDTLDVAGAKHSYHCERAHGKGACFEVATERTLPPSAVIDVAVGQGAYAVSRLSDARIAGERAKCFRIRSTSGRVALPDLGADTLLCLTLDGIPLSSIVDGARSVDTQTATSVQRAPDDAAITRFLADFDTPNP
jgi:hypothetical protein